MTMWEARQKTAWQNFRHEMAHVIRGARADRRNLGRDFSRRVLGGYRSRDAFNPAAGDVPAEDPGVRSLGRGAIAPR